MSNLTPEQQQIKELSLALYEQAKEIAQKDQKIRELEATISAIQSILKSTESEEKPKNPEKTIFQKNKDLNL